ncbi:MAG: outer membrane lipoprotein carrier protein LolA [Candidatus Kapabacteria bacterium]|nr:outer membrane lipoprotein carrier protein LolA [Candidatus Kapabacteria bacterium]
MKRLVNIMAGGLMVMGSLHASAADILESFHARYRSLSSISMRFAGTDGITGSIVARKGGKYRIEAGGRTIACDGRTVWNAQASTKSVIVNAYKPLSSDVSLERVFFEIISVYRSSIVEQNPSGTVLRLTAPQPAAIIANVTSLDLTLDPSATVRKIVVTSGPSKITYSISKLRTNQATPSSLFSYTIPKGWEVLDLR